MSTQTTELINSDNVPKLPFELWDKIFSYLTYTDIQSVNASISYLIPEMLSGPNILVENAGVLSSVIDNNLNIGIYLRKYFIDSQRFMELMVMYNIYIVGELALNYFDRRYYLNNDVSTVELVATNSEGFRKFQAQASSNLFEWFNPIERLKYFALHHELHKVTGYEITSAVAYAKNVYSDTAVPKDIALFLGQLENYQRGTWNESVEITGTNGEVVLVTVHLYRHYRRDVAAAMVNKKRAVVICHLVYKDSICGYISDNYPSVLSCGIVGDMAFHMNIGDIFECSYTASPLDCPSSYKRLHEIGYERLQTSSKYYHAYSIVSNKDKIQRVMNDANSCIYRTNRKTYTPVLPLRKLEASDEIYKQLSSEKWYEYVCVYFAFSRYRLQFMQ